jgi:hypothetical protein
MTKNIGFSVEQCPLDSRNPLSLDAANLIIRFQDNSPPIADAFIEDLDKRVTLLAAVEDDSRVVIGAATCMQSESDTYDYSSATIGDGLLEELRGDPQKLRWEAGKPLTQIFNFVMHTPSHEDLVVARSLIVAIANIAMSRNDAGVLSGAYEQKAILFRQLGFAGNDHDLFATPQKLLSMAD